MSSFLDLISEDICTSKEFRGDFGQLTISELYPESRQLLEEDKIAKLLESSVILSVSKKDDHKRLAYKIVIYLLNQYKTEYNSIPFVAELVLTRLGDLPVIEHLIDKKDGLDFFSFFPKTDKDTPVSDSTQHISTYRFPEVLERKALSQVTIAKKKVVSLTDFQADILRLLRSGLDVAFSAPTSAGKSYLLANYLGDRFSAGDALSVVYIAPTKALVAEVQGRIVETFGKLHIPRDYLIFTGTTVQGDNEIRSLKRKVFVLTQERLQEIIANKGMNFDIDILVIDEAQQVANEGRGVIFEDAIKELIQKNPNSQKIFIAPYITNPESFAEMFSLNLDRFRPRQTGLSPVAQNIFFVKFSPTMEQKKYHIEVSALSRELLSYTTSNKIPLANIESDEQRKPIWEKKLWVVKKLIPAGDSTLIYCNTRGECRKLCEELSKVSKLKQGDTEMITAAINFLREHVHPDFYLIDHLRFGVGYHYGTMPQFVKAYIRILFEEKGIDYLACTSTLLEGVNLPAKNLVVHKPRRGNTQKMTNLDVKNLIGRAGRLRWDYYGNIYCINVDEWDTKEEPFEDRPEIIESASVTALSKHSSELMKYLFDRFYEPESKMVKPMATSLMMKQLMYPDEDFLAEVKRIHEDLSQEDLDQIRTELLRIAGSLAIADKNVYLKNRSLDPRLQDDLYDELKSSQGRILPPNPTDVNFYSDLLEIFRLIAKYLLREAYASYQFYNYVATEWIWETSYKGVLQNRIDYLLREEPPKNEVDRKARINQIIENVNEVLEEKIRFDYTRGLKCYIDLIQQIQDEEGTQLSYCKELHLYLEAGASSSQILYLIAAGLYRNTAIEIAEKMTRSALPSWTSVTETLKWLEAERDTLRNRLHPVIYEDIERLLGERQDSTLPPN